MMKVVNDEGNIVEVTETAYEILYKDRGFQPHNKTAKVKRKNTSSSKKKVKDNDES